MSRAAAEVRCHMLDSYAALAELSAPWQALCDECPWVTPFQRPDWLLPWIRYFGPAEPWLFAAWAGERLVGLVLLFRYERDGQRVLAFLGAGISDYLDVVIAPGWQEQVIEAVLAALCARSELWDVCELDEVRAGSPLLQVALPPGLSAQAAPQGVCPVLHLPSRPEDLGQSVPESHLRRFYQYRRRALREGCAEIEHATPLSSDRMLDELFRLHEARWWARCEPGVLAQGPVRAFHRDVAARFSGRDALSLCSLHKDGQVVACFYGFVERETLYYYLSGFEPAFRWLSPGTLIVGIAIENAVERGLARFDFLRGSERYKYWWGAADESTMRLCLRCNRAPHG